MLSARRVDDKTKSDLISLAEYIESRGHQVNKSGLTKKLESKPEYNEQELSTYHKNMLNSIKQCDFMIVDISTRSSGLGYQIAVALNERKPVLAVYHGSAQENSSLSLKSNPSKLLEVKHYKDMVDLKTVADEFIQSTKDKIDTKFILIISPEIDKYLAWTADNKRMHKAQVVRTAIEDMMHKDKEYKTFLKQHELGE